MRSDENILPTAEPLTAEGRLEVIKVHLRTSLTFAMALGDKDASGVVEYLKTPYGDAMAELEEEIGEIIAYSPRDVQILQIATRVNDKLAETEISDEIGLQLRIARGEEQRATDWAHSAKVSTEKAKAAQILADGAKAKLRVIRERIGEAKYKEAAAVWE